MRIVRSGICPSKEKEFDRPKIGRLRQRPEMWVLEHIKLVVLAIR